MFAFNIKKDDASREIAELTEGIWSSIEYACFSKNEVIRFYQAIKEINSPGAFHRVESSAKAERFLWNEDKAFKHHSRSYYPLTCPGQFDRNAIRYALPSDLTARIVYEWFNFYIEIIPFASENMRQRFLITSQIKNLCEPFLKD